VPLILSRENNRLDLSNENCVIDTLILQVLTGISRTCISKNINEEWEDNEEWVLARRR
jgi:hypothetical protein